jgi:transcriptional regulator with XRE-family HTH domain
MAPQAPPEIRVEVLTQWLQALSRDDIAKMVGIGACTVSEILKAYRQCNPDFDHLRELVVAIKRGGVSTEEYTYTIRLRRMLNDYGLSEEHIESLIRSAANHCFKKEVGIQKFIENVERAADLSAELGLPVVELPDYMRNKERELGSINRRLVRKKAELDHILKESNAIEMRLQEYKRRLPTVEKAEWLIGNLTNERDVAKRALETLLGYRFSSY